ncbi:MAG: glycosyltransferase family 39 protein [Verrucomicrobiota bacterium]
MPLKEKIPAPIKSIFSRIARLPRAQKILLAILLVLGVALARFLYEIDKPWEAGVTAAEAEGKKPRTENFAFTALWWAAWFNLAVTVALALLSPWLTKTPSPAFKPITRPHPTIPWIPLTICLLIAVVLTGIFTVPRLNHSLWFDEEYTMRRVVVADYKRMDDRGRTDLLGQVNRRPVRWAETLWFYEMPNNHPFYSICARLAHSLAAPDFENGSAEALYFSERALRLPAWLAGIGALFTIALMLARLGFPRAAMAAPLLLALHPWFLRYASEARGYVFLFFLGPLLIVFLDLALTKGKWRWFIAYGLTQTLYIYSNASGFHLLALLNLTGFALAFLRPDTAKPDRWMLAGRLFLVNSVSAMIFIQLFSPNFLQFAERFNSHHNIEAIINANLLRDMIGSYTTGIRWHAWDPSNPNCITVSDLLTSHPIALPLLLTTLAALALLGIVALWKQNTFTRFLILVFVLPAPLFVLEAYRKGLFIFYWYAIFILPFLWALVALGIDWFSGKCGKSSRQHTTTALVAVAAVAALFAWLTQTQRSLLVSNSIEPAKESVHAYREILNPFAPNFDNTMSLGFWKYTRAYDPGHFYGKTFDDFTTVIAHADKHQTPLYVNYAMPGLARGLAPDIMGLLDNPEIFEPPLVFWGLEPAATRFVSKYIPGSYPEKAGETDD